MLQEGRKLETTARKIPKHMQRYGGRYTRQRVNQRGIGELFLQSGGSPRLQKLAKPCARIRKSPRRHLDREAVQARQRTFQG